MRFVDVIKGIGSSLSKILGDDPRFRVEPSDEGVLVTELVKSGMTKADAAEAIKQYRDMAKEEKKYSRKEESAISLETSDKGYKSLESTTPETEKSTSFRDDSSMQMVRNTGIKSTSANELPNSERQQGGKERDSRMKWIKNIKEDDI